MNYARNEDQLCANTPQQTYSTIINHSFTDEGAELVTLAEAKSYLRIDASETTFDTQVTDAIAAARQEIENYLNMSLIKRTVTVAMNIANGNANLPYGPVIGGITTVKDADGKMLDTGSYILNGATFKIDGYSQLVLTYDAGYEEALPAVFKRGILRLLAFDWQHRGDDGEKRSLAAITGLKSYRRVV